MKIEICIGEPYTCRIPDGEDENGNIWYVEETGYEYEHEGYYDSIDDAIKWLLHLKELEEHENSY